MQKIIIAIPHSHTWFWLQTCISSLMRNPPKSEGFEVEIIVIDNSPWSPAIRGITDTQLGSGPIHIRDNYKTNRFHASALDCIVEKYNFDFLMALETDVLALHPDWLQWFVDKMQPTDYAVGMWHHEQFINPSCTLYRGDVLRRMLKWCKGDLYTEAGEKGVLSCAPQNELRWGERFNNSAPLDSSLTSGVLSDPRDLEKAIEGFKEWVSGPFAEKRGWTMGSVLKEAPSGQLKGPGWYEPGQQLHHWAVEQEYTYTICPSSTYSRQEGMPVQTLYGGSPATREMREFELLKCDSMTAHLWGGTRALDIVKHEVTCGFVKANTPYWLAREARFWKCIVPPDIQAQTLELIRKYGWHYTGQGSDHISDRDRAAAEFVRSCYKDGGVEW